MNWKERGEIAQFEGTEDILNSRKQIKLPPLDKRARLSAKLVRLNIETVRHLTQHIAKKQPVKFIVNPIGRVIVYTIRRKHAHLRKRTKSFAPDTASKPTPLKPSIQAFFNDLTWSTRTT